MLKKEELRAVCSHPRALSFEGALFCAPGGDEMGGSTIFDYYYGDESNLFSFYRIPRQLITGDAFKRLSTDAKLLYGLLLDRMSLSAKHGWYDEQGRVYSYNNMCKNPK